MLGTSGVAQMSAFHPFRLLTERPVADGSWERNALLAVGRRSFSLSPLFGSCYWGGRIGVDLPLMLNTDAIRARLEVQLAELKERQERIAQDLAEPLNADSSEQAVELEDDASLEGQAALVAREIASVTRALLRVEKGTYGECVRCGAEIAPKRLEARPEASLCISCANQQQ